MSALSVLFDRPLRFCITVLGVALCVVLMLFLLSIYRGVRDGSVDYVRSSEADLWVLQPHATNILRGSSLLVSGHGYVLQEIPGIDRAAPVLFVLATMTNSSGKSGTVYLTGFDPETGCGGPPSIYRGRPVRDNHEIVLDRSFAAKHRIRIGDLTSINNDSLRVVGLCEGTNMFVIQYAFVTLEKAQLIAGLPHMVSCYQVSVSPNFDPVDIAADIRGEFPDIAVFGQEEFLRNNIREMESGVLPMLYMVACIGAVVLTVILSLILSVNVLEQRQTFAILKALGAPSGFIPGFVVRQALILACAGTMTAFILFHPLRVAVQWIAPEVSVISSFGHMVLVAVGVTLAGLAGSLLPNQRLRHIYPLEAFS